MSKLAANLSQLRQSNAAWKANHDRVVKQLTEMISQADYNAAQGVMASTPAAMDDLVTGPATTSQRVSRAGATGGKKPGKAIPINVKGTKKPATGGG